MAGGRRTWRNGAHGRGAPLMAGGRRAWRGGGAPGGGGGGAARGRGRRAPGPGAPRRPRRGAGGLAPALRPLLVDPPPPFAVLGLAQREAGAEAPPRPPPKSGDRAGRVAGLDQLTGDRDGQLLAGLG